MADPAATGRLHSDAGSPWRIHQQPRPSSHRVVAQQSGRRVHVGQDHVEIPIAVNVAYGQATAGLDDLEPGT